MKLSNIGIDSIDKNEWSKFVLNHSNGTVFQTPELYNVYDNTKNYTPLFVAAADQNGAITGILLSVVQQEFSGPLKSLSRRCVTWAGPLIKEDLEDHEKLSVLDFILKEQTQMAKKKAIYMQFRNLWDTFWMKRTFEQNGYEFEERFDILIDITQEEEELMKDMKKDKRRAIKKAIKSDIKFINIDNKNKVNNFYDMLKETYNDAKVPLPDQSFFDTIYEYLVKKGLAKYFLAELDGKYIAGRVALFYKNKIFDWYAGDFNEYTKYYPNEFLVWNIWKYGKEKSYKCFDFFGAGKPNVEYGVKDWKMRFGGQIVKYGRYNNVFKKKTMKIAKMGMKILKG